MPSADELTGTLADGLIESSCRLIETSSSERITASAGELIVPLAVEFIVPSAGELIAALASEFIVPSAGKLITSLAAGAAGGRGSLLPTGAHCAALLEAFNLAPRGQAGQTSSE